MAHVVDFFFQRFDAFEGLIQFQFEHERTRAQVVEFLGLAVAAESLRPFSNLGLLRRFELAGRRARTVTLAQLFGPLFVCQPSRCLTRFVPREQNGTASPSPVPRRRVAPLLDDVARG
jgi:hypothetical protein